MSNLTKLQQLVVDIAKVKRNHTHPGTNINENVVEHSFSIAMLSWKIFDELRPPLSLERIFKYALAHDFLERGLEQDINTYASNSERQGKRAYEERILADLTMEFGDFSDMTAAIHDYEQQIDEESRFVRIVDKMQAIILGEMDDWAPYKKVNISYEQFYNKGEEFMKDCPECLKETLTVVLKQGRSTYYDQPDTH